MFLRICIPASGRFVEVALFAVQPHMKLSVRFVLSTTGLSSIVSILFRGEMASFGGPRLPTTKRQLLLLINEIMNRPPTYFAIVNTIAVKLPFVSLCSHPWAAPIRPSAGSRALVSRLCTNHVFTGKLDHLAGTCIGVHICDEQLSGFLSWLLETSC